MQINLGGIELMKICSGGSLAPGKGIVQDLKCFPDRGTRHPSGVSLWG